MYKNKTEGVILTTDMSSRETRPQNGTDFQCHELQKIVGGHFELVRLMGGHYMIVNEDGHSLGLPYNLFATLYLRQFGMEHQGEPILGDVLICHKDAIR